MGRRIEKNVDGVFTRYLYSNEGLIGEYDINNNLKKSYGWMPNGIWGTDPLYMTENNQTYVYHNDALGTPQKMTDASGNVVWSAAYTAFGEATVDAGSTITNNLRFAGQYFDQETGNHYNWNRYYDPRTGKYMTKDPIGFGAGDTNLYRFVKNRPTFFIDPFGWDSLEYYNRTLYYVTDSGIPLYSWSGVSGPWGKGPLPPGDYDLIGTPVTVPPTHRQQSSYCDPSGNCWWQPIKPSNFSTDRSGFGIHPDGNKPGTAGCIGITEDNTSDLREFLRTHTGLPLKVLY